MCKLFFSLPLPTLNDDLAVEVGRHLVAGRELLEHLHAVHGGLDEEAEVAGARALGPHHGEGDGELGGADQVGLRAVLEPGTEMEQGVGTSGTYVKSAFKKAKGD